MFYVFSCFGTFLKFPYLGSFLCHFSWCKMFFFNNCTIAPVLLCCHIVQLVTKRLYFSYFPYVHGLHVFLGIFSKFISFLN